MLVSGWLRWLLCCQTCLLHIQGFLLSLSPSCLLLFSLHTPVVAVTRSSLNMSVFSRISSLFPSSLCFQTFHDSAQMFPPPKSQLCPSSICIYPSLSTKHPFQISHKIFSSGECGCF